MEYVMDVNQVTKNYSKFIFGPINLSIPEGFATAFIGSNGAGKTTLFDLLAGVSLDKHGDIRYWNNETNIDANDIREQIGYVSANNYFPPTWTVRHVAHAMSFAYKNFNLDRFNHLCKEFDIDTIHDKKKITIEKMSDGNKMRLMLASVFARDTRCLVLDEPASSLDPVMRDDLCNKFREYIAEGNGKSSILFSTHNVADMEMVTDYAVFMNEGKVIEEGFVEELKDRYTLVHGELSCYENVKKHLIYGTKGNLGFDGILFTTNRRNLVNYDLAFERPTLHQLSIYLIRTAKISEEEI